jgi:hypothetical protein
MSSVRDIMVVSILLFVVGIIIVFVVGVSHSINTALLNVSIINDTTAAREVVVHADTALDMTDYLYLALFIGFFLSIIITGWFMGGLPIAAPIYFFVVILFTFLSLILQMAWVDIVGGSVVSGYISTLPITNYILSHLGYFVAVFGLVGILMMFAKPGEEL